jgi:hypothetical protein
LPSNAPLQKRVHESTKHSPTSSSKESESLEEESEQSSDKSSIMKRLLAQGAVSVFPSSRTSSSPGSASSTPTPTTASEESEQEPREEEEQTMAPSTESESDIPPPPPHEEESAPSSTASAPPPASTPAPTAGNSESEEEFHSRVQKQTDKANNPSWYDLPQHIENARHGKWDLSQSRERSGSRKQDVNLEEDVRTNQAMQEPGTFDIKKKAKKAINDVTSNPGQTLAGMVPIIGKGLKQKLAEKNDVKERNVLRGVAATTTSDEIRGSASSQASAVSTKINNERFKAGVGTVTGIVGDLVPGAGKAASAVGAVAGAISDQVSKKDTEQVKLARARETARKQMGGKEFGQYENVDEFISMENQRHALVDAGKGKKGVTAAALDSEDQVKRMTAHARGDTQFHKNYKKRAEEVVKERAEAAKPKEENTGMLSKFKNLFKRSG